MKKKRIKILCDTMSDLPNGVKEKYDVEVIPTAIILDGKEYKAGLDITSSELCEMLRATDKMPTTAQVTYMDYQEVFERNLKDYDSLIYLAGSSAASGTSQTARLVASDIEGDIYIIDTMSLSIGGGMLITEALKMIEEDKSKEEIIDRIEELKEKVHVFFSVGNLEYLQKGGRISGVKATIGTILNISPILSIEDGLVKQKSQVRGASKVIPSLINHLKEISPDGFENKDIFIGCGDEIDKLEKLKERVERELSPRNIFIFEIGSCVVSHSGPSVLGIAYLAD